MFKRHTVNETAFTPKIRTSLNDFVHECLNSYPDPYENWDWDGKYGANQGLSITLISAAFCIASSALEGVLKLKLWSSRTMINMSSIKPNGHR